MRTFFSAAILCLFITGIPACCYNSKDISIRINNTAEQYEFKASYPGRATGSVQDYINESIAPNRLFTSTRDYFNVYTQLQ